MEENTRYLIVGAGLAGVSAAQAIRQRDPEGRLILVGQEPYPPYDRPPLSKQYLLSDEWTIERAYSKNPSFYSDRNVELYQGVKVTAINRTAHAATLEHGATIRYEKLLLATGARPRRLTLPGSDLDGLFYLRAAGDAEGIRAAMQRGNRAVMVGAGYIGMEVAAACAQRGIDVTVIERAGRPWANFASPTLGDFLRRYYEERGVRFIFGEDVSAFVGDGRLTAVATRQGSKVEADFAVVGVGAILNSELAREAGLEVDERHGVRVDSFLRTSDPNIWAAGDIACFEDLALGKQWHVEHYMNAEWQGAAAGAIMAGENKPFNKVAYFFSDIFDIHMCLRGDPEAGTGAIVLGDLGAAEFVELYHDESGRVRMGVAISHDASRPDAIGNTIQSLIRERANVAELDAATFGL